MLGRVQAFLRGEHGKGAPAKTVSALDVNGTPAKDWRRTVSGEKDLKVGDKPVRIAWSLTTAPPPNGEVNTVEPLRQALVDHLKALDRERERVHEAVAALDGARQKAETAGGKNGGGEKPGGHGAQTK